VNSPIGERAYRAKPQIARGDGSVLAARALAVVLPGDEEETLAPQSMGTLAEVAIDGLELEFSLAKPEPRSGKGAEARMLWSGSGPSPQSGHLMCIRGLGELPDHCCVPIG